MPETTRLFISIPICPETAPEAYDFLSTRREQFLSGSWAKRVRWVAPEQFHLTLRFLDQVATAQIPDLAGRLQNSIKDIYCFTLTIKQPCLFPRASRAKLIACPVEHGSELKQLRRRVHAACAAPSESDNSTPENDRYRAHITLGRIRPSSTRSKAPNLPSFPGEATLRVGQIDIVASLPFHEGVRHEVLHRITLP